MKLNHPLLKVIALHLSLMLATVVVLSLLFFHFALPILTRHGQSLTVPHLKGMALDEVDACLAQRSLHFQVTEEIAYDPDYPPMTVLQQHPKAGSSVKEGRKIYLTLNTNTPPQVAMPHLVDGSVRNAHMLLKSRGLLLGTIQYVPDLAQHAVLEQQIEGQEVAAGTLVPKGTKIDLVVGAGLGHQRVPVPAITAMKLEEARLLLLSVGIKMGNIAYERADAQAPGTVLRQLPAAGRQVRVGETVDLWLVGLEEEAEAGTH